jgi:hypothetical protein
MNLGTILIIVAIALAVVDGANRYRSAQPYRYSWLLNAAVVLIGIGILIAAAPLPLK